MLQPAAQPAASRTLAEPAEALALVSRLTDTVRELSALLAAETELVRASRPREAAPLEPRKTALSHAYAADLAVLKANVAFVRAGAPREIERFRAEHEAFAKALELNLAVLATAHAVAESVIRSAAAAAEAKRAPSGYGANGRMAALPPRTGAALAISRSL